MKSFRVILFTVLLAVSVLITESCATRSVYVGSPPPAARHEVRPARPFAKAVWISGHWEWRGNKYVWKSGHWVKPVKGKRWSAGHWKKTPRGHVWVNGRWIKR